MLKIKPGKKIRTWGGWYVHDEVYDGSALIGRVQTRRRNKRTETITCAAGTNACVLGRDLKWLQDVRKR